MNYTFRTRPVVVEAFQMTRERRWDNTDWPAWLHQAWNADPGPGALFINPADPARERLVLGTRAGLQDVAWDAWIIRGVQGELYACVPDIFAATYDEVQ